MMSTNCEKAVAKIVDFGLSKMIGPSEKAKEPYGTLGYCAPEILEMLAYTCQVDLYSLGCIVYSLIVGALPFDHTQRSELIRMTRFDPANFNLPVFSAYSLNCLDFVKRLLIKDPNIRITLAEAVFHPWFTKLRATHVATDYNSVISPMHSRVNTRIGSRVNSGSSGIFSFI